MRARGIGIKPGILSTGKNNAITDVEGVLVGQVTLNEGDSIRTGATAILPHGDNIYQNKVPAAAVIGNGFGKMMGYTQIHELGEIETPEMIEVQLVNAVAPFVLCNRLSNLMKKENTGMKHIINVSAMEGKFHRFHKEDRHPHTNMAKAALNMMTHTSAASFAKDGIYMNAVDTGWVTDEDPAELSKHKEDVHDFQPPLDIVDGAARVLDPLLDGINRGKHWCGKFLKDYMPIDW